MHASASWLPAKRCIDRHRIRKPTMDDIASEVGLSRPSVYRYFADRDDLIIEPIPHHARTLLDRAYKAISRRSSLPDQIVGSLLYTATPLLRPNTPASHV
jgi:AcrR family transcriptional regulator